MMSLLTYSSIFFLPLSFLATTFGMNFDSALPHFQLHLGYLTAWLFMIASAVGVLVMLIWALHRRGSLLIEKMRSGNTLRDKIFGKIHRSLDKSAIQRQNGGEGGSGSGSKSASPRPSTTGILSPTSPFTLLSSAVGSGSLRSTASLPLGNDNVNPQQSQSILRQSPSQPPTTGTSLQPKSEVKLPIAAPAALMRTAPPPPAPMKPSVLRSSETESVAVKNDEDHDRVDTDSSMPSPSGRKKRKVRKVRVRVVKVEEPSELRNE